MTVHLPWSSILSRLHKTCTFTEQSTQHVLRRERIKEECLLVIWLTCG